MQPNEKAAATMAFMNSMFVVIAMMAELIRRQQTKNRLAAAVEREELALTLSTRMVEEIAIQRRTRRDVDGNPIARKNYLGENFRF